MLGATPLSSGPVAAGGAERRGGEEGMLAVLGGTEEQVTTLAEQHELVLANDNAPGQVVLAGPTERLRAASRAAREQTVRARSWRARGLRSRIPRTTWDS